jgi:hypothetical protein
MGHRVTCAVDCGIAINPNTVVAQMEGSIAFGLTAALKVQITIRDGRVEQSNLHDYPILRMDEMSRVDTYILSSKLEPGGIDEPGVPPLAPALANAVYTGYRQADSTFANCHWRPATGRSMRHVLRARTARLICEALLLASGRIGYDAALNE